jgi:hypothetical protein
MKKFGNNGFLKRLVFVCGSYDYSYSIPTSLSYPHIKVDSIIATSIDWGKTNYSFRLCGALI